jgi:hypothetical protein
MDETYCCTGCAAGGPCLCTYEADLADDGVNHLGLPFAMDVAGPREADAIGAARAPRSGTEA